MTKKEIDLLDEVWRVFVKQRKNFTCEHCGIMGVRMEAAHVVGRRHRATRWGCYIDGKYDWCGHCFCHNCHQQYDEHGPLEGKIIQRTVGQSRKDQIQFIAHGSGAKGQFYDDIKIIMEKEYEQEIQTREHAATKGEQKPVS
jgi:hypothetical protein